MDSHPQNLAAEAASGVSSSDPVTVPVTVAESDETAVREMEFSRFSGAMAAREIPEQSVGMTDRDEKHSGSIVEVESNRRQNIENVSDTEKYPEAISPCVSIKSVAASPHEEPEKSVKDAAPEEESLKTVDKAAPENESPGHLEVTAQNEQEKSVEVTAPSESLKVPDPKESPNELSIEHRQNSVAVTGVESSSNGVAAEGNVFANSDSPAAFGGVIPSLKLFGSLLWEESREQLKKLESLPSAVRDAGRQINSFISSTQNLVAEAFTLDPLQTAAAVEEDEKDQRQNPDHTNSAVNPDEQVGDTETENKVNEPQAEVNQSPEVSKKERGTSPVDLRENNGSEVEQKVIPCQRLQDSGLGGDAKHLTIAQSHYPEMVQQNVEVVERPLEQTSEEDLQQVNVRQQLQITGGIPLLENLDQVGAAAVVQDEPKKENEEEAFKQDAVVANVKPRCDPLPDPDEELLAFIKENLSDLRVNFREFSKLGNKYVEEAFQKQFTIKNAGEKVDPLKQPLLFNSASWMDEVSRTAVSDWGVVRKLRKEVSENWAPSKQDAYRKHMSNMSLTPYLKSFIRNSFPNIGMDETYDYPAIVEVVRAFGLEYDENQDISIVNIGDPKNAVEKVYLDIGRGKPVERYSILAKQEQLVPGIFYCPTSYRWPVMNMDKFKAAAEKKYLHSHKNTKVFKGVDIIYQKLKIDGRDRDREIEFSQCRMVYCTIVLSTIMLKLGGSLIINASHIHYDGFFIGLMYLLALLFEEVHLKKPVASLDATVEVWIVAKNYLGVDNKLKQMIHNGNDTNIKMTYIRSRLPLSRKDIPETFMSRMMACNVQRCKWVIQPNLRNLMLLPRRDDHNILQQSKQLKLYTAVMWVDHVKLEDLIYRPAFRPAPAAENQINRQAPQQDLVSLPGTVDGNANAPQAPPPQNLLPPDTEESDVKP